MIYNDSDPFAAAWLRELIAAGELPEGHVDERPIESLQADECAETMHFFAGIGGWPLALEYAGWPRDVPVWTGSCPCQPFSVAGKREGEDDERHLWPAWLRLIAECRPPVVFGEQVTGPDGLRWLAGVRVDLEALGYAVGAADLPAGGVGAPHKRQRIFFAAVLVDSDCGGWRARAGEQLQRARQRREVGVLAYLPGERLERPAGAILQGRGDRPAGRGGGSVAYADGREPRHRHVQRSGEHRLEPQNGGVAGALGDADRGRLQGQREPQHREQQGEPGAIADRSGLNWCQHWQNEVAIRCLDGKARRVEPSIQPLVDGVPNRLGTLRGAGNAIVPQVAAVFVRAAMAAGRVK